MFRIIKPRLQHHFLLRQKYPLKTAYSHLKPLQHYHTSIHRFLHSSPSNTKTIKIVEVSPRDGLQNIPTFLPTSDKITLIQKLQQAGCCNIEATAFVSPKWVPQMSDAKEVLSAASKSANHRTTFSCLVPNARGLHEAVRNGAKEVAVFGSASETFSRKNINCGIEDSFGRFREVCSAAKEHGVPVRGYVSCVMGCPYEGHISKEEVARVSGRLVDMGCDEISLGDSIGVGTAGEVVELLDEVKKVVDTRMIAVHFHDTYGQSLANIYAAICEGVSTVDSSVSGIGGCPYAAGATGNVATEDVVYMLHGLGLQTGINIDKLIEAGSFICNVLGTSTNSRVAAALNAKKKTKP